MDDHELKIAVLALAVLSWTVLAAFLVGVGRFRPHGAFDRAVAFLLTATMTRLAFTHVHTRWQIAAFVAVASLAVAAQAARTGLGAAAVRWAASVSGIVVGAVVTREIVHHYLERWL